MRMMFIIYETGDLDRSFILSPSRSLRLKHGPALCGKCRRSCTLYFNLKSVLSFQPDSYSVNSNLVLIIYNKLYKNSKS